MPTILFKLTHWSVTWGTDVKDIYDYKTNKEKLVSALRLGKYSYFDQYAIKYFLHEGD